MTHEVALADADFFKLQASCQACGEHAYYRLGTAAWEHDPLSAGLTIWYGSRHRWSHDELTRMQAALDAPDVDSGLDAWFENTAWRHRREPHFVAEYRRRMTMARNA